MNGMDPEKTGTRYGAGFIDNNSAEKRAGSAMGEANDNEGIHNTPLMKKKLSSGALNNGLAGPEET
jgi:hypothetical protein